MYLRIIIIFFYKKGSEMQQNEELVSKVYVLWKHNFVTGDKFIFDMILICIILHIYQLLLSLLF